MAERTPAPGRVEDRFWSRVQVTGFCWEWVGGRSDNGYGSYRTAGGASISAHRFAYQEMVGAIPAGMHVDHLCRVRHCVNPDHLEPVTPQENARRGISGLLAKQRGALVAACAQGHPYTDENTYTDSRGWRQCRECSRLRCASRPKRAACPVCGQERDRSSMSRHMKTMHPDCSGRGYVERSAR